MDKLFITGVMVSVFGIGMFCGAIMSDIEWYETLTSDVVKCSTMDSVKLCDAKIKFHKAVQEFNNAHASPVTGG